MATWDDHDYGVNDGGEDYPQREASEQEFLRFWQVPEDSPVRSRSGVYDTAIFGPEGRRVQIILLDTRYFRSQLSKGERRVGGPYIPDDDLKKTMLGEQQWAWLENELKKPAEVRIIGSSIQCIPEACGQETWGNLPRERERLFQLITDTKAEGVVIVSGDRHWAELSVHEEALPYPLYEMTSSSFNQIHPRGTPTENRFRGDERTYHRENYGVIRIDWSDDPSLTMEVKDIEGVVRLGKRVPLSELKP
jgi:alkaline phosphatase D